MGLAWIALAACVGQLSVGPPPPGLDPFYTRGVSVRGVAVVASARPREEALWTAARIVDRMLSTLPEAVVARLAKSIRVGVMAQGEQTTDMPEHRDLNEAFPGTDWNARARGLGATAERPLVSCAEENLLGLAGDRYRGECILIHEFAHSVLDFGLAPENPGLVGELGSALAAARKKGLWERTYAASNAAEYWAEGVQSYFDANLAADPPNGIHNAVRTRRALKAYDPVLFGLIDRAFAANPWRWRRP